MCFSAQAWQDPRKYTHAFGAEPALEAYAALFRQQRESDSLARIPKAMLDAFTGDSGDAGLRALVQGWKSEQATALERELFAQKTRLANAERALAVRVTKKAQSEQRIATDKIARAAQRLKGLRRTEPMPQDERFFPGQYATVMVSEGGKRKLYPMRYGCRPAGKPAFYDTRYPGTYNARRSSLEGYWKRLFGHCHALIVVETFFENVEGEGGGNTVLQFTPRDRSLMYVACLWSHWTDPKGKEPDLLSFAAITDAPEPEVAAAGHDRTIINIKPEHVDAWLEAASSDLASYYGIFDDKRHPYYEHREAA